MSDRLIPEDFDASFIPDHTADLGIWLRRNGVEEDVVEIVCGEYMHANFVLITSNTVNYIHF